MSLVLRMAAFCFAHDLLLSGEPAGARGSHSRVAAAKCISLLKNNRDDTLSTR